MTADQQQRIKQATYDGMYSEPVQRIAAVHRLTVRRAAGLVALAQVVGGCSLQDALRLAEQAARWNRGDPTAAVRALHRDLPITSARPRQRFGNGSTIKIALETWASSRALLSGPPRPLASGDHVTDHQRRERAAQWSLAPDAPILFRHRGDPVGTITAAEVDTVTADLRIWATLTDPTIIEASLFRELSCSPGLHPGSPMDLGYDPGHNEWTRTWLAARVLEVSLVPVGCEALTRMQVDLVSGAPADLAADWAGHPRITSWDEPRSARSDRWPFVTAGTGVTPDGQRCSVRSWPGMPGLTVR